MTDDEIQRIREVYSQRSAGDRYHSLQPDQVAIAAQRAMVWGAEVLRLRHELGCVVEVGCGSGSVLRWAWEAGARCCIGFDVQIDRLATLRGMNCRIACGLADGRQVPLRDGIADTVVCSTVFSSVLDDAVAHAIALEVERVLRPGGVVLWFDFFRNNPANPHVRAIRRADIRRLFPQFETRLQPVVLAPPIARRLGGRPRLLTLLEQLRFLRTHLAGVLVAPL